MRRCPARGAAWTLSEVIFDRPRIESEIKQLEERSAAPDFWNDPSAANQELKKLRRLKNRIEPLDDLQARLTDVMETAEMLAEEPDEELGALAVEQAEELLKDVDEYELQTMLSGEHDARNAIVEINAGAGGSEACDWAEMLYRLYLRWAERRGFKIEPLSETPGDVTGYRSVGFQVNGDNAYGFLKSEAGTHRLVRISPFDAAARRHTSFVRVEVLPETEETEIEIDPDDLKIDTMRASGAGGQHVNKTESAVRITHVPTGIVVQCQNERSQHKNKASAMKMLASRLAEVARAEDEEAARALRGDLGPAEWGRQIRSYVLQPYTMVKDHRTGHETGNTTAVLDGDIDGFIEAFLKRPPDPDAFVE